MSIKLRKQSAESVSAPRETHVQLFIGTDGLPYLKDSESRIIELSQMGTASFVEQENSPAPEEETYKIYSKDVAGATELFFLSATGQEIQVTDDGALSGTGGAVGVATALATTAGPVNVSNAGAPTTGQVLQATSATTASWQTISLGGNHGASHQDGGADAINLTGLSGLTADPQKSEFAKAGTLVSTRKRLNLVEGSNVTITVADNAGGDRTDVTIAAAGGGGGGDIDGVTAGTGLSGGGTTGTVTLDVVYGSIAGTAVQGNDSRVTGAVSQTRSILTGTGLTGGGDLSADRTLAVQYGTIAGTAAQGNDPRLADARTPTSHKASHNDGGSDELSLVGLSGLAADPQKHEVAKAGTLISTRKQINFIDGSNAVITVADNVGSDRTDVTISSTAGGGVPSAHKESHQDGGSDKISIQGLSGRAADPQTADRIGAVSISGVATSGQVLTASSNTTASWQTPSTSGGSLVNETLAALQFENVGDVSELVLGDLFWLTGSIFGSAGWKKTPRISVDGGASWSILAGGISPDVWAMCGSPTRLVCTGSGAVIQHCLLDTDDFIGGDSLTFTTVAAAAGYTGDFGPAVWTGTAFLVLGTNNEVQRISADGATVTRVLSGHPSGGPAAPEGFAFNYIASSGGITCIVGYASMPGPNSQQIWYTNNDGGTWAFAGGGSETLIDFVQAGRLKSGAHGFIVTGQSTFLTATSANMNAWTQRFGTTSNMNNGAILIQDGIAIVADGESMEVSPDLVSWTSMPGGQTYFSMLQTGCGYTLFSNGTDLFRSLPTLSSTIVSAGDLMTPATTMGGNVVTWNNLTGTAVADSSVSIGALIQANDARLTDDRRAASLKTATNTVMIGSAAEPSIGQVLTATSATGASWQSITTLKALTVDAILETPTAIAYASSVNCDTSIKNDFVIGPLTGPITINLTNPAAGRQGFIATRQDATGNRVVTLTVSGWTILRDSGTADLAASPTGNSITLWVYVMFAIGASNFVLFNKLTPV